MTGEGLEPSTHGLTYLTGFHRPRRSKSLFKPKSSSCWESGLYHHHFRCVALSLWSRFPRSRRNLACWSPNPHRFSCLRSHRYRSCCGVWGYQGFPAIRNMHIQRLVYFRWRLSLSADTDHLKSDALPTELPGRVSVFANNLRTIYNHLLRLCPASHSKNSREPSTSEPL